MTNSKRLRYPLMDLARIVLAILVIANHTSPLASWNPAANLILTRIIARLAVPFFFTASSFFFYLHPQDEVKETRSLRLFNFVKKTLKIYTISTVVYLPMLIYNKQIYVWANPISLARDILFDGTVYHLWYLPASIIGMLLVHALLHHTNRTMTFFITLVLYFIGLFGDSYYGFTLESTLAKNLYEGLFVFFDYTRNGLFFAPIFCYMGYYFAQSTIKQKAKTFPSNINPLLGFALSFIVLMVEALVIHNTSAYHHDSMYGMLVLCIYFLFPLLMKQGRKTKSNVRELSLLLYVIHPAVIIFVRALGKFLHLQKWLIDDHWLHFLFVVSFSFLFSWLIIQGKKILAAYQKTKVPIGHKNENDNISNKLIAVDDQTNRAWIEIDLDNLSHNVNVMKHMLAEGCEIIAVVKANAYGHDAVTVASKLEQLGVNRFAVASIDEGIALRNAKIKGNILILGYTPFTRANDLFRYSLTQTITDADYALTLHQTGKLLQVQIKIDTGMHRLGESHEHIDAIATIFSYHNLLIRGMYTHLSMSDMTDDLAKLHTANQIKRFYEVVDQLKQKDITIPPLHIQSTYGIIHYPQLQCQHARIGLGLYGILSDDSLDSRSLDLRPLLSLKARVVQTKEVKPGDYVGYARTFKAKELTRIAIVSIGYADGLPRNISSLGYVLIRQQRYPMIGRICMDQFMVDVSTNELVCTGDVVTLIGRDGKEEIRAEEVARYANTITNELLSRLGERLPRIVIED